MSDFSRLMELALAGDAKKAEAAMGLPGPLPLSEQLKANEANPPQPVVSPPPEHVTPAPAASRETESKRDPASSEAGRTTQGRK